MHMRNNMEHLIYAWILTEHLIYAWICMEHIYIYIYIYAWIFMGRLAFKRGAKREGARLLVGAMEVNLAVTLGSPLSHPWVTLGSSASQLWVNMEHHQENVGFIECTIAGLMRRCHIYIYTYTYTHIYTHTWYILYSMSYIIHRIQYHFIDPRIPPGSAILCLE